MKNNYLYAISSLFLVSVVGCQSGTESTATEQVAAASGTITTLLPLNTSIDRNVVKPFNASLKLNTTGETGLQVDFQSKQHSYSSIVFSPETPWNWSEYQDFNLAMDIANPGEHSVQVYLDISDVDGGNYTRTVSIPVGGKKVYYAKMAGHDLVSMDADPSVELNFNSGLRSNPDTWESDDIQFISMWGKKNLNLSGITKIGLSVQSAMHDKEIVISNIRLRHNPEFNERYLTHIVDKFGQNSTVDFEGKIHKESDFAAQRDEEAKSLDNKLLSDRSKWGGWKDGPKLKATGYFRTEKVDGKWSLVDPDGHIYIATGLDIIRLANSTTMTGYDFNHAKMTQRSIDDPTPEDSQGLNRVDDSLVSTREVTSELRKDLFQELPAYDSRMGQHYGYRKSAHSGPLQRGETYSFYSANLDRKYGDNGADYMQAWEDITVKRMKNWGFTSLGNWTDPRFYDNDQVPYFANGWVIGDFKTVSSGNDFWGALPDVYDPKFAERADFTARTVAAEVNNSPWCVGVFIDNEKSFGRSENDEAHYGIVIHTLKRDGKDVPTKAAFTQIMKDKYGTIDALNKVWGTQSKSWDDFNTHVDSTINNKAQVADYGVLLGAYAGKYFSVVEASLEKHMPNHLYLGARFPDWGMPIEVVKASAEYVDVVSYNAYKEGLHPSSWKFLEEIDMPSIIGEFHVGASDSGLYHPGLIHASDQEDRGRMFVDYMNSVVDNPYFVGAHWFQYIDSPITGRAYDGENYNVGFISVTDTPYRPMVEAAKEVNTNLYKRRYSK
ncbi:beta-galactosidase [Echinimonas agarilytica]|uniref:Beta-galactosidase n=1 Tax=Echinimonas agarilytica TaxID=1215918 RepID=A0AA42B6I8_9GAMM|nr:beta-galactosidase [Echinimonas agarilytica]MCM2678476.1 beta-galactosidase [Echinimonas agarilytica]